jgi:hypothetical protein
MAVLLLFAFALFGVLLVGAAFVYGDRTIRRCVLAAVVITLALAAWVLSLPPPEDITNGPTTVTR